MSLANFRVYPLYATLLIAAACGSAAKKKSGGGTSATESRDDVVALNYFVNNQIVENNDLGNLLAGAKKDVLFLVSNNSPAEASNIKIGGIVAPFNLSVHNCDGVLAVGAECVIHVVFQPTEATTYNLKLELTYTHQGAELKSYKEMTGKGLTPALLSLSDGPRFDFGSVAAASTAEKAFTLTNSGQSFAQDVRVGTITAPFSNKTTGTGSVSNCGQILAPGNTCTVVILFAPTAAGSFSDVLSISYNDGKTGRAVDVPFDGVTP